MSGVSIRAGIARTSSAVDGGSGTVRPDVLLGRLVAGREDAVVRGAAHVERLAVEVRTLEAEHLAEPRPQSEKRRIMAS